MPQANMMEALLWQGFPLPSWLQSVSYWQKLSQCPVILSPGHKEYCKILYLATHFCSASISSLEELISKITKPKNASFSLLLKSIGSFLPCYYLNPFLFLIPLVTFPSWNHFLPWLLHHQSLLTSIFLLIFLGLEDLSSFNQILSRS